MLVSICVELPSEIWLTPLVSVVHVYDNNNNFNLHSAHILNNRTTRIDLYK